MRFRRQWSVGGGYGRCKGAVSLMVAALQLDNVVHAKNRRIFLSLEGITLRGNDRYVFGTFYFRHRVKILLTMSEGDSSRNANSTSHT